MTRTAEMARRTGPPRVSANVHIGPDTAVSAQSNGGVVWLDIGGRVALFFDSDSDVDEFREALGDVGVLRAELGAAAYAAGEGHE